MTTTSEKAVDWAIDVAWIVAIVGVSMIDAWHANKVKRQLLAIKHSDLAGTPAHPYLPVERDTP